MLGALVVLPELGLRGAGLWVVGSREHLGSRAPAMAAMAAEAKPPPPLGVTPAEHDMLLQIIQAWETPAEAGGGHHSRR